MNFKDLAIFNQVLTANQVQQLFLDEATPPLVTASGTMNTFTVGGAAMAIDSGVTITSDDPDLTTATVTISAARCRPATRSISRIRTASAAITPVAC